MICKIISARGVHLLLVLKDCHAKDNAPMCCWGIYLFKIDVSQGLLVGSEYAYIFLK